MMLILIVAYLVIAITTIILYYTSFYSKRFIQMLIASRSIYTSILCLVIIIVLFSPIFNNGNHDLTTIYYILLNLSVALLPVSVTLFSGYSTQQRISNKRTNMNDLLNRLESKIIVMGISLYNIHSEPNVFYSRMIKIINI